MMAYEYSRMMKSDDPLCPLSSVGGETFHMRCHENCAWLVTMENGNRAICGMIAGACGEFIGAPVIPKNPIRIKVSE